MYCVCEEESILLKLMLGNGSQGEIEAGSYDSCAVFDKQQEEAANKLESVTSLPASNETIPCETVSPGAEEPAALEGTSVAGPNTGLEGTDMAGPSSGSEGTSVASAGSVEMGIDGPVRALASCQRRNGPMISSGRYLCYWWRGK